MKRVCGTRFEIELLIPPSRLFVLRVHNERTDSCNISRLHSPQQSIFKKGSSDSGTLLGAIHCQSGEYHYRDWMPRKPFQRPFRRLFWLDRAHRQAVIADDTILSTGDIRLRCVGRLVRERESLQEPIELFLSAVEGIGDVFRTQLTDRRERSRCVTQVRSVPQAVGRAWA